MSLNQSIGRLLIVLLGLTFAAILGASYWAVAGAQSVLLREDNPRNVEFINSIQRGAIYDRKTTMLAESALVDQQLTRLYTELSTYNILGYYSTRYGTGGVEAFFDPVLSGRVESRDWAQWWRESVLHLPRVGQNIRLTLDLTVQKSIALNNDLHGAVILMTVPDGRIIGVSSAPTFDPNVLDEQWDQTIQQVDKPFFNRALQGQFQPGGTLQTPLMAINALSGVDVGRVTGDGSAVVRVDDVTLSCAIEPIASDLTLLEAYAYGCPRPYEALALTLDPLATQQTLRSFMLDAVPVFANIDTSRVTAEVTLVPDNRADAPTFAASLLGQGNETVNPMALLRFYSAILNSGNAPQFQLLDAVQDRNGVWQSAAAVDAATPLLTRDAAEQVKAWMLNNAQVLGIPQADSIGVHLAVAYAGDYAQAWFVGFRTAGAQTALVVVVLENSGDPSQAMQIGLRALEAYEATVP